MPTSKLVPRDTPQIGKLLPITITNLPVDIAFLAFAPAPLPAALDLSAIGMPGCDAHIAPNVTVALVGAQGVCELDVSIPNTTSLFGSTFANQAVILDPGAGNYLGAVVSDAAMATVGG